MEEDHDPIRCRRRAGAKLIDRSVVALAPVRDLLLCAKHLFVAAMNGKKAPAIDGRGKLAERIEVEFGPFRPAASRRAECFLVALPPVLGSSAPKICSFGPGLNQRSGVPLG